MNLKELINNQNLFGQIDLAGDFPFIGGDAQLLNNMLVSLYGQKPAFKAFADYDIDGLANMIVMQFKTVWKDYADMEAINKNATETRTLTETVNNSQNVLESSTGINKVSAYNTELLIDNDGSETQGVNDLTGERVRTLTDTKTDSRRAYLMLNSATKDSIIKSVLNDVSGFLTLDIY